MAADEEIAGHEIAGEDVNATPILPPTTDPANTCEAYAEIEYAGECIPVSGVVYPDLTIHGDSCDAYAEVEYAGECVDDTAIFPSLPTSTVEDFDTSTGRLGCGVPSVFITTRCSSSMTCQIDLADITKLMWTRRMDEVSEAEVEIGLTGDASQTCCQCLADVEPFCHELHIWRDGEEVWVGPIEAIKYEREKVTIKARDSLAWLDVRIPTDDIEFSSASPIYGGLISDNPLTVSATTVNAALFNTLPVIAPIPPPGGLVSMMMTLDPGIDGSREYVKIIGHTAGATSVTVVRGQFGTPAKSHIVGSQWNVGGLTSINSDYTQIARYIMNRGFADDVSFGFDCEYNSVFSTLTGQITSFFHERFNSTYLEALVALAEGPVFNFTTLGRTIVLSGDTSKLTPLVLLNDEHIMGEIDVTKDGKQMVNRQYVHFDGDVGVPSVGAIDYPARFCYNLIERIMDSNGLQQASDADVMAQAIANAGYIAPRIIEIPAGARLSPDTPWTINSMVPGTKVNVAITRLCLSLTQSFRLIGVSVEYTESDGELIGIELSPINNLTDSF